jgi:hypothetical protein
MKKLFKKAPGIETPWFIEYLIKERQGIDRVYFKGYYSRNALSCTSFIMKYL